MKYNSPLYKVAKEYERRKTQNEFMHDNAVISTQQYKDAFYQNAIWVLQELQKINKKF